MKTIKSIFSLMGEWFSDFQTIVLTMMFSISNVSFVYIMNHLFIGNLEDLILSQDYLGIVVSIIPTALAAMLGYLYTRCFANIINNRLRLVFNERYKKYYEDIVTRAGIDKDVSASMFGDYMYKSFTVTCKSMIILALSIISMIYTFVMIRIKTSSFTLSFISQMAVVAFLLTAVQEYMNNGDKSKRLKDILTYALLSIALGFLGTLPLSIEPYKIFLYILYHIPIMYSMNEIMKRCGKISIKMINDVSSNMGELKLFKKLSIENVKSQVDYFLDFNNCMEHVLKRTKEIEMEKIE